MAFEAHAPQTAGHWPRKLGGDNLLGERLQPKRDAARARANIQHALDALGPEQRAPLLGAGNVQRVHRKHAVRVEVRNEEAQHSMQLGASPGMATDLRLGEKSFGARVARQTDERAAMSRRQSRDIYVITQAESVRRGLQHRQLDAAHDRASGWSRKA